MKNNKEIKSDSLKKTPRHQILHARHRRKRRLAAQSPDVHPAGGIRRRSLVFHRLDQRQD